MVDEVPFPIVLDGAEAAAVKVDVRRHQGRFQEAENRIVGRVVEIATGNDPVDADGRQRVRQEPQPFHGDAAPGL